MARGDERQNIGADLFFAQLIRRRRVEQQGEQVTWRFLRCAPLGNDRLDSLLEEVERFALRSTRRSRKKSGQTKRVHRINSANGVEIAAHGGQDGFVALVEPLGKNRPTQDVEGEVASFP